MKLNKQKDIKNKISINKLLINYLGQINTKFRKTYLIPFKKLNNMKNEI